MTRSIAEILATAKKIQTEFQGPSVAISNSFNNSTRDIRYPRITKTYCVLAPVGYEWKRITIDVYEGDVVDYSNPYATYVNHGHPVGLYCFAPKFCHVAEYEPVGNESETFLKLWKDKWG